MWAVIDRQKALKAEKEQYKTWAELFNMDIRCREKDKEMKVDSKQDRDAWVQEKAVEAEAAAH